MHRTGEAILEMIDGLHGRKRGRILISVSAGWVLAAGVRQVLPALLPRIRTEFGLGLTEAGTLVTLLWAAYAVAQFPGGMLGDRFGERNVLTTSKTVCLGGLIVVVLSTDIPAFYAGMVLTGFATGLFATTRFTVLSDVFPERASTAQGVVAGAGNVGTSILPVAAGLLAATFSWRFGFGYLIPAYLGVVVALWLTVPERTSRATSAVNDVSAASVRRLVTGVVRRNVLLCAGTLLLMGFVYQSFAGLYPTYLVEQKGLSDTATSGLFGLFFAAGVVIQPAAGMISDQFGERRAMLLFIVLGAVGLVSLPVAEGVLPLITVTVLLSTQLGYWPISQAFIIEFLPDDMQGSGFGLLRSVYLLIASTGPLAIGSLADAGYFDAAYLMLAVIALAAGGLALLLPSRAG